MNVHDWDLPSDERRKGRHSRMRGRRREPLAPWKSTKAFWTYGELTLQPAQNVGGLNVVGTLDILTRPLDADLELDFDRRGERSRQVRCPFDGDLVEYSGQLPLVLFVAFTSDQCTFRLIRSQGTPPVIREIE
jgi:hypothetical protein